MEANSVSTFQNTKYRAFQSLAWLVKLSFPEGTWIQRKSIHDDCVYIIELPPTHRHLLHKESLKYCRELAQCIEFLGYRKKMPDGSLDPVVWELSPEVYKVLESGEVLPLPNLQSYYVSTQVEFITLPRVVGPKIVSLEFASADYKSANFSWPADPAVVPLPRTLCTLNLHDSEFPEEISDSLILFLSGKHNLLTLKLHSCDVLGKAGFYAILSSEKLMNVKIRQMTKEYLSFIPPLPFPGLRYLTLTVECLDDFIQFLQRIGNEKLSKLWMISTTFRTPLNSRSPPPAQVLRDFFSQIQNSCKLENLPLGRINFSFFIESSRELEPSLLLREQSITLDIVQPLLKFSNLRGGTICYQVDAHHKMEHCIYVQKVPSLFWSQRKRVAVERKWKVNNVTRDRNFDLYVMRTPGMIGC